MRQKQKLAVDRKAFEQTMLSQSSFENSKRLKEQQFKYDPIIQRRNNFSQGGPVPSNRTGSSI